MGVQYNTACAAHVERLTAEIAERAGRLQALLRGEWPEWARGAEEPLTLDQEDEARVARTLRARGATGMASAMPRNWLRIDCGLSRERCDRALDRLRARGRVETRQGRGSWLRNDG